MLTASIFKTCINVGTHSDSELTNFQNRMLAIGKSDEAAVFIRQLTDDVVPELCFDSIVFLSSSCTSNHIVVVVVVVVVVGKFAAPIMYHCGLC